MTAQTILLSMAGGAGLHALAGGLAMAQQPDGFGIVVRGTRAALGRPARRAVTIRTEYFRIVAIRTFETSPERRRCMPLHETVRMKDRLNRR